MSEYEPYWIWVGYGQPHAWDCSECGAMVTQPLPECPKCHSKMHEYAAVYPIGYWDNDPLRQEVEAYWAM